MADVTLDNGSETNFSVDTKQLAGGEHVQRIELVSAEESGPAVDLAKENDTAHSSGDFGLVAMAVRQDTAAALADDGNYLPLVVDDAGRLHVNIGEAPAASRTTDAVAAALQTDKVMDGLTELTPKFKSVTVAASQTDSEVVAAVTSKKIRVLSLVAQVAATATDITFESNGGSDTRLHKIPAGANGGQVLGFSPAGHFETLAGEALIVTTGSGSSVEITLTYIEV